MSHSLGPHGHITRQTPLSMKFSRQEYQSGLPCPPPGDVPNSGTEPWSPALQVDSVLSEPPWKPWYIVSARQMLTESVYPVFPFLPYTCSHTLLWYVHLHLRDSKHIWYIWWPAHVITPLGLSVQFFIVIFRYMLCVLPPQQAEILGKPVLVLSFSHVASNCTLHVFDPHLENI